MAMKNWLIAIVGIGSPLSNLLIPDAIQAWTKVLALIITSLIACWSGWTLYKINIYRKRLLEVAICKACQKDDFPHILCPYSPEERPVNCVWKGTPVKIEKVMKPAPKKKKFIFFIVPIAFFICVGIVGCSTSSRKSSKPVLVKHALLNPIPHQPQQTIVLFIQKYMNQPNFVELWVTNTVVGNPYLLEFENTLSGQWLPYFYFTGSNSPVVLVRPVVGATRFFRVSAGPSGLNTPISPNVDIQSGATAITFPSSPVSTNKLVYPPMPIPPSPEFIKKRMDALKIKLKKP